MSTLIFGSADVAATIGVSRQSMSNYLRTYGDSDEYRTPAPTYVTPDGRRFWDSAGVDAWSRWLNGDSDDEGTGDTDDTVIGTRRSGCNATTYTDHPAGTCSECGADK